MTPDGSLRAFLSARPRLFGIAYRMLGSATEAEDVIQDVWLRWQKVDPDTIREPVAWLTTATTRLAINVLTSARSRRETYVGPWLPEPIDTSTDPALGAERAEALELGILLLMEKLTPSERAAYVLREAFDYPYGRIAEILHSSEPAVRQLVSRGRKHLAAERRRAVAPAEGKRLLEAFVAAARRGDLRGLEELLDEDVVSLSDGGGVVSAARVPVVGRERVARFVSGVFARNWAGVAVRPVVVNGAAGVALVRGVSGRAFGVVAVAAGERGITRVMWMVNPGKLDGVPGG